MEAAPLGAASCMNDLGYFLVNSRFNYELWK